MEKGVEWQFDSYMRELFQMQEVDIRMYSPLALAYIGDCIFDLIIRSLVLSRGNRPVQKLHRETSRIVRASSQSRMMRVIQKHLTEEEYMVYRRGRNCRTATSAKNQTVADYRRATGFEALLGYLYLKKEWKRLLDLVRIGLDGVEEGGNPCKSGILPQAERKEP